jgi:hypothetical protein
VKKRKKNSKVASRSSLDLSREIFIEFPFWKGKKRERKRKTKIKEKEIFVLVKIFQ